MPGGMGGAEHVPLFHGGGPSLIPDVEERIRMEKRLLEAAERGDAAAQFNLGILYENGLGDSRYVAEGSRPEAVRWLLAAAEQGLPRAQIKLAEMYAGEPEMPDSAVRACGWILLATASLRGAHLQSAQSAYQRACTGLTPAEIEQAKSFAQRWRPSPWTGAHCWIRKRVPREQVHDQELVRSANRHSHPDRPGPGGVRDGPRVSLKRTGE
jgi:hypothetical protein